FTITWSSNKYDGSGWQVCGQQFTSSGARYGSEFVISTSGAGDQQFSSIAMNSLGQAVVVWTASGSGSNPAGVYGVNLSPLSSEVPLFLPSFPVIPRVVYDEPSVGSTRP